MKVVTQRTGLTSHTVRVWERRYGAVVPERTETNRRHYSDADIERLELLQTLIRYGHSIGQIAGRDTMALQELLEQERRRLAGSTVIDFPELKDDTLLGRGLRAVVEMDHGAMDGICEEAAVEMGHSGMLLRFVIPMMKKIGELWHAGRISAAHEHVATASIRTFLLANLRGQATPASAPGIVVGTPDGQMHELGAAIVASLAAREGWRVTYLGPSLPAHEIAQAALRTRSSVVALSIVYPADDPNLGNEIRALAGALAPGTRLLIGGMSAGSYLESIERAGATFLETADDVIEQLSLARSAC